MRIRHVSVPTLALMFALLALANSGCERRADVEQPAVASAEAELSRTTTLDYDLDALPIEEAVLGYAPNAAPPITRTEPARVIVELEVTEEVGELADGTEYMFWTFGQSVPGPMIRVREGDTVEVHLMNHPDSLLPHNIDLHAVIGPGGGAESTFVAPGERRHFTFRPVHPGVYIYHCATAPVGMHIANGMYGLIVVDPLEGWPEVDREIYVVQSEFYTPGSFGDQGLQPFDMDRALAEDPSHVVFNGRAGSMIGDNAPRVNVGENVRIFFGNGGPNLTSSFHIIGEIFDTVYHEAGTIKNHNIQTTIVPAGGATVVEFETSVPSTLVLVDHAIFRAFNKGAIGTIVVEGEDNLALFEPTDNAQVYVPSPGRSWGAPRDEAPAAPSEPIVDARTDEERINDGRTLYNLNCASCHNERGTGVEGVFPALTGSAVLLDTAEVVDSILVGRRGDIGYMPSFPALNTTNIADIVSYAQTTFGAHDAMHDPNDIQAIIDGETAE